MCEAKLRGPGALLGRRSQLGRARLGWPLLSSSLMLWVTLGAQGCRVGSRLRPEPGQVAGVDPRWTGGARRDHEGEWGVERAMENSWPAGGRSARFDLEVLPFVWWGSRTICPGISSSALSRDCLQSPGHSQCGQGPPCRDSKGLSLPPSILNSAAVSRTYIRRQPPPSWSAGRWVQRGAPVSSTRPLVSLWRGLGETSQGALLHWSSHKYVSALHRDPVALEREQEHQGQAPQALALALLPAPWGPSPGGPKASIPRHWVAVGPLLPAPRTSRHRGELPLPLSSCPGLLWVEVPRVPSESLDQAFLALGGGRRAAEGTWVRLSCTWSL